MESNVAFGSGAVDRSDPAKVRIEYIAEVFQENKNVCLREIRIFLGSGRSQKIKSRLEFALCGPSLRRLKLVAAMQQ